MAGADTRACPARTMQPKALAELMEGEKVTLAAGVPTIWMGVLPELKGRDLSRLRDIVCGGSAVPQALSEALPRAGRAADPAGLGHDRDEPGRDHRPHASRRCADKSEDELADLRAAQGMPIPLVELRIVEPGTDEELPWDGEARGELQAIGPWIARRLLQRRALRRLLHRGRLAAHRRRRDDQPRTATSGSSTAPRTS